MEVVILMHAMRSLSAARWRISGQPRDAASTKLSSLDPSWSPVRYKKFSIGASIEVHSRVRHPDAGAHGLGNTCCLVLCSLIIMWLGCSLAAEHDLSSIAWFPSNVDSIGGNQRQTTDSRTQNSSKARQRSMIP